MNSVDSFSSTMHIINVLPDDRHGGPSNRVIQVANKLAERGIKTTLCLPSGEGNAGEIAHEAGISVRRVRCERIPRPTELGQVIRWGVRLPRDIVRFARLFSREKPDLVHLSTAYFLPPAIAARLTRVPLLWHLNDIMVSSKIAPLLGTIVRVLSDKVVVSAESVASHFGLKAASYEVAYPPVDIGRFVMTSQGGWHGERKARVGFVANWNPVKGVDYFVRAMSEVRAQFEGELEIIMAGARLQTQEEYTAHVNELIEELDLSSAIQDHGFVPSVGPVIESLDVLVLSSTSEAFGMSALEGMAAGVPVVVTDVGGVREMVGEGEGEAAGIVVKPKEPAAIARAVLWLLDSPSEAARMGNNGRRRAKEKFSLERSVAKHLELYLKLAAKAKRS